jgi:hypothetical protein
LIMGWYVVFKEGNETLTQIVPDRDEAILVACAVYLQGHLVLAVGPYGQDTLSNQEIEGAELLDILRKLANEGRRK